MAQFRHTIQQTTVVNGSKALWNEYVGYVLWGLSDKASNILQVDPATHYFDASFLAVFVGLGFGLLGRLLQPGLRMALPCPSWLLKICLG